MIKNKIIGLVLIFFTILSCSQNSNKIAGIYKFKGSILLINADNSCFILAENTCIKGVVAIEDTVVKIKSYIPEVPFVLYGRKNNNYREEREGERGIMSNKIMFLNFDNIGALVNMEPNNNTLQKMTAVFNNDANCIDYPLVRDNENPNEKFYFAIKDQKEVYEFEKEGYSDFIVHYIKQKNQNFEFELHWNKKTNQITYEGKVLEKEEQNRSKKASEQLISMYERAYPESEYYYCNSSYNFFEERGIDVHSKQYKKEENFGEYYYLDQLNGPPILHETDDSGQFDQDDKDAEYHSTYQINEYRKIQSTILKNISYTLNKGSIFTFNCK